MKNKMYSYSTDVLKTLGAEVPGDELVFGIELESMKTNINPLANTGVGIWKEDSSCWGEFVTKPMSYEQILEWAASAPLHTIKPSADCGMHVHVNRNALTQKEACRLALLLSDELHEEDINFMSGRKPTAYCSKVKDKEDLGKCRYEAVNLTNFGVNKNTVEIRVFSSTNKAEELMTRMLWVKKLIEFVKSPWSSEYYSDFLAWEQESYNTKSTKTLKKTFLRVLHTEVPLPSIEQLIDIDIDVRNINVLTAMRVGLIVTGICVTPVILLLLVIGGMRYYQSTYQPDTLPVEIQQQMQSDWNNR